jgi:aminoglycoside phosphotransferase (APT) family kinase protein
VDGGDAKRRTLLSWSNRALRGLLHHLATGRHEQGEPWPGGPIRQIEGGWSNLLYRVTGPSYDWAVKFTVRDRRDRAGREYHALQALRQAGRSVAPEPLLLDRRRYPQPVVVQTWLAGEVSAEPPTSEADWERLLQHMATIHSVTPATTPVTLLRAVVDARSAREGRELVQQQMAKLPENARPPSLQPLMRRFEATGFPRWPSPPLALCRTDNNILNVIRRPGPWASVDWENAGWGDPAFDVAQLMTHPAYLSVPSRRWDRVVATCCRMADDEALAERIRVYHTILAVWWVARVARFLYEWPRGLDRRLAERPEGWEADMRAKYAHYLRLAQRLLP